MRFPGNNKYSVPARAVGQPVEIQAYADRIMVRQDGEVVAEHVPVRPRPDRLRSLALRARPGPQARSSPEQGAFPRTGTCRAPWGRCCAPGSPPRRRPPGWWTFSGTVLTDGLAAVGSGLRRGVARWRQSSAVILNILARRREAAVAPSRSSPPPPCAFNMNRLPIAPGTATCGDRPMERHEVLQMMTELKLGGMRAAFDEVADQLKRQRPVQRIVGDLLRAEIAEKAGPLDQVPADHRPGAAGQGPRPVRLRRHADQRVWCAGWPCGVLAEQRNAVLVGGTGTGKSHLAIAIARSCIRGGAAPSSSQSSIWSTGLKPRPGPAVRDAPPSIWSGSTWSFWTSLACRSPNRVERLLFHLISRL